MKLDNLEVKPPVPFDERIFGTPDPLRHATAQELQQLFPNLTAEQAGEIKEWHTWCELCPPGTGMGFLMNNRLYTFIYADPPSPDDGSIEADWYRALVDWREENGFPRVRDQYPVFLQQVLPDLIEKHGAEQVHSFLEKHDPLALVIPDHPIQVMEAVMKPQLALVPEEVAELKLEPIPEPEQGPIPEELVGMEPN